MKHTSQEEQKPHRTQDLARGFRPVLFSEDAMRRSILALLSLTGCGILTTFDPPGIETPAQCTDGMDNDGDGAADCADTDCTNVPACPRAEDCGNNLDDDQDGLTDCLDSDCASSPDCAPVEDCDNNLDDDADGEVDCDDSDCAKSVNCAVQGPIAVDDDAADLPELNGTEDEALRFPAALLLANDQDPDGGALGRVPKCEARGEHSRWR
jgi:hypothetical protein